MILHAKKQHSVVCPFRRIGFIVPLCRTRKRLANSDYPTIIRVERQVKPNPSRSWMNSFDEIFFNDTKNSRPLRRNQTLMQVVVRQIPSIRIYNCIMRSACLLVFALYSALHLRPTFWVKHILCKKQETRIVYGILAFASSKRLHNLYFKRNITCMWLKFSES